MEREDKILTAIFEQSRKEGSDNNIKKEESDDFCDENFSAKQSIFSAEVQEKDDESEDGSYEISASESEDEESEENDDSQSDIHFAEPRLYNKKGTEENSCGFVLKEGVFTALPIEPEDYFLLINDKNEKVEASEWLLFLHDSNDKAVCVLDYYKAIQALKNLAVYGEKYLLFEQDGFVFTNRFSKKDFIELTNEVVNLENEERDKEDTAWSPNPATAAGRMAYWIQSYHLFIMMWLLVLSIHCPAMYDFGGFASVLKSAALSAAFLGASFLSGFLGLYLLKPVLKMFDIGIFRFCIYSAHFVMVAFVIGFVADLIFLQSPIVFLGQNLAAISSVPLGLLLASIAVFKKEYNKLQRR